jgi:hypothetical protein
VTAAVSTKGRDVILNTIATASKVAQALNTPETKVATTQVFETLQSLIDFFASPEGRKVIATAGECLNQFCEVAASPESSIFLAEIATNLCHAMDVEAQRKGDNEQEVRDSEVMIEDRRLDEEYEEEKARPPLFSPTSSAADTGFETESNASDFAPYAHRRRQSPTQGNIPAALKKDPPRRREKSASGRSARIEKDVLLKMGVDPAMIGEIQRVLDTIATEEENTAMKEEDARSQLFGEEDDYTDEENGDDAAISHAFGLRSSSPPPGLLDNNNHDDERKQAEEHEDPDAVILPEWHEEPLRQALRRRHAHVQDTISQRHTYEDQARDMANVLTQRQIRHGNVDPADMFAVRVISLMITYGIGSILLLIVYKVMHLLIFA